jgi:hypothetical protein
VSSTEDVLMLASGDHGAQLWDVGTGELLTGALGVGRSALAPDGSTLFLGARPDDPAITALPLDVVELERSACASAGRNLTLDEWRELMGDRPYRATCPQWPAAS